jgi:uncharacterized protein YbaA (DUF1428 family)
MNNPEQKFSKWLRGKLPGHCLRVENVLERGTPDINWCHESMDCWIETKIMSDGKCYISPEQYAWGVRRMVSGGVVFIIALDPEDDEVYVWMWPLLIVRSGDKLRVMTDPCARMSRDQFSPVYLQQLLV